MQASPLSHYLGPCQRERVADVANLGLLINARGESSSVVPKVRAANQCKEGGLGVMPIVRHWQCMVAHDPGVCPNVERGWFSAYVHWLSDSRALHKLLKTSTRYLVQISFETPKLEPKYLKFRFAIQI
eukprot:504250-Pelagomonas_calceolata.AAC.3